MNTLGNIFRLTDFGESHGPAIGGIIDGVPSLFKIDRQNIALEMARRRPGNSSLTSARKEDDEVEILSGLSENDVTLGTPIGLIIRNKDQHSKDYENLRHTWRPNHADFTYDQKYGIREHRGGGRASARETACRVFAGAIAKQILGIQGVEIRAKLIGVGGCREASQFETIIKNAAANGDSVGGLVECLCTGVPVGLGEPVFGKLQAQLASAMMSINGAKGFEYGDGFEAANLNGSESVDAFEVAEGKVITAANHSGGIQGGISNGMPIVMRIAFKPTPTLGIPVKTLNSELEEQELIMTGRHDPCIAVRGVAVVESMAAITLLDAWLMARLPLKTNA